MGLPSRAPTNASTMTSGTSATSNSAVPDIDPNTTSGLLSARLVAWKTVAEHLREYMAAIERVHHEQAKEYEKALKAISKPLKYGENFDQNLGGIAGFLQNVRANTEALSTTNRETEASIRGSVLPVLERLEKEIKHKDKELDHRGAKSVEKVRNTSQKHIEALGQQTASFDSTGGKMSGNDDPYVVYRGVMHRLHKQCIEENNHRNELINVQTNFENFEHHVIAVLQEAMEKFTQLTAGQGEKARALHTDMLHCLQRVPQEFEWKGFVSRQGDKLMDPNGPPKSVDSMTFPNMDHPSTKPLIEGTLERKSRNKLAWKYQNSYYVVTPSKFLHEFKDSDDALYEPKPELSIYLPDAVIGEPNGPKFNVKGKDRSKGLSSKFVGSSELAFKAHTAEDASKWFEVIKNVAGATGPAEPQSPQEDSSAAAATAASPTKEEAEPPASGDAPQESGVIGDEKPAAADGPSSPAPAPGSEKVQVPPAGTDPAASTPPAAATPPPATSAAEEKKMEAA